MNFDDYTENINPISKLDKQIDESGVLDHINKIADHVANLDKLVPMLGIENKDYKNIKGNT